MRQRVVTALFLAFPALLALALRTPWPLAGLGLLTVAAGGWEADRLLKSWGQAAMTATVVFVLFGVTFLPGPFGLSFFAPSLPVGLLLLGVAGATLPDRLPMISIARGFAGLWVVAGLLAVLMLHRAAPGTGRWCLSPALMALVPVWAGDIAAIFAGKAFGKRPLAPRISPKKTVEGSVASLLASLATAFLLGLALQIPPVRALGAGLAVGILGQAGDLFESWLKRRADVKDSGTLLPGHGGVLDRIDSVLFAAPAVALVVLL